jgi:hypothetical protein
MGTIVRALRKYSGRGRMVLIGPVRLWFDKNSDRDYLGGVHHGET